MSNSYAKAYKEVLIILNNLPKEEYEKIPKEEIKFYEENCAKEYYFEINNKIPLKNQNISKKANSILVMLFRDYIATDRQKEKLKEILYYNTLQKEKIAQEKYNPDNIFKNRPKEPIVQKVNLPVEVKKEALLKRLLNFIKKVFMRSR